jgi:hypothetical protein
MEETASPFGRRHKAAQKDFQFCHSERSEESLRSCIRIEERFLASLGMTKQKLRLRPSGRVYFFKFAHELFEDSSAVFVTFKLIEARASRSKQDGVARLRAP